jgi:hypothetical protein
MSLSFFRDFPMSLRGTFMEPVDEKARNQRTRFLINPPFQYRFMAWMSVLGTLAVMLLHLSHLWFFYQLRKQALNSGIPANHVFFQFISDQQQEMGYIAIACFVGVLVISVVFGLVLSHRIAGPMFRLRKHLETVAQTGVHEPVQFREDDFFKEIPKAYNLQFKKGSEKRAG